MSTVQTTAQAEGKRLFKSTFRFGNVVTPKGHILHFKGGMFATNNPAYIEYLDSEIANNGFAGTVFIDPNARTITAEQENPLIALRKKFYEEFEAERAGKLLHSNDMGNSEAGKLTPASTSDIAPTAAGGDASQTAARLMELAAQAGKGKK